MPFLVEASDTDGFVRRVEFFADGTKFGEDQAAPHTATLVPSQTGRVRITAVAWDDDGDKSRTETAEYAIVECPPDTPCEPEPTDFQTFNAFAPIVHWVSPKPRTTHVAPAIIVMEVTATATHGEVSTVEFLNGTQRLTILTKPPYRYTWRDVPAGTHTVVARARSTNGTLTESAANTIRVTSP